MKIDEESGTGWEEALALNVEGETDTAATIEIQVYLKAKRIPVTGDALKYWNENQIKFPKDINCFHDISFSACLVDCK